MKKSSYILAQLHYKCSIYMKNKQFTWFGFVSFHTFSVTHNKIQLTDRYNWMYSLNLKNYKQTTNSELQTTIHNIHLI